MATVVKDFKVKAGLVVEGTTGTINNQDILTKKQADQDYIINLVGGAATPVNTPSTIVERDASGNFAAGTITANVTGQVSDISNHDTGDLAEGTNKYFTDGRAVTANTGLWDTIGAAATAAADASADLTAHENLTVAHGATGAVVGTTNTQTLTNKTIGDTLNFTGAGAMTINSDSHIVLTPAAGSSVKWGADVLATQAYADQAEVDAKAYTDTEIADLVGAAPALLDTLNELSVAIANNPNYATDAAAAVAGRVAKSGDTMTGALTLSGAPTINLHAATKAYVDSAESNAISTASADATSKADAAEADAIAAAALDATSKADAAEADAIAAAALDATSKANAAEANAIAHADALTTSDVAEGTSQYFTTSRAKVAAANLITTATKTNITITGDENGLTISAENGVADSTTSDLVEGTNLYFTDARAVSALEAVTPKFVAVELNSVAKQVAATLVAATAGVQTAHAFAKADYRSAEYLVKVAYGTHTEVSKVLLTLDSSDNIAITEYAIVGTNGSASSISAGVSGSNVQLLVTTANNNSTVTVMGTLLK